VRRFLLFLFSHRFLALARWDLHFIRIRTRNAITFQNRRIRAFVSGRQQPVFLNLGSGPRGVDDAHWVNVDGFPDRGVHYLLDIDRPLPFADGSFDGIFCEHVLEHFTIEAGDRLAREAHRVLRRGGCLRVIVPDAELLLQRYFTAAPELIAWRGGGGDATAMEIVNSYFYQRFEHQFLYDWPTLQRMLTRAGFGCVLRSRFGSSDVSPALVLDDAKYEWESLYVEAVKA
jgi:predicted SAM-dependent methyltransferase